MSAAAGVRAARAIVVLGCRVRASGRLTAALGARAEAAAAAYRAGVAPIVLASGGRRWGPHIEAIALKRAMVSGGVPEGRVLTELFSLTTHENAVFSAALLRSVGVREAVVVTSAWHLPRALMSFRAAGIEAEPWPCDARADLLRRVVERVRWLIDARAMGRASPLAASAATFFGAARDA